MSAAWEEGSKTYACQCFLRIVMVVMAVVSWWNGAGGGIRRRRGVLLHRRRRRHRHHRRCSPRRPSNQKLFVMYTYKYYYMLVAIIISNSVIHRLSPSFLLQPQFSTTKCTLLLYSLTESRNSIAASLFAGEFGFGSHNKLCIDVNTAATS